MRHDTVRRLLQEITMFALLGILLVTPTNAQDGSVTHEGLEVSVSHLERAVITPLGD